jgi:hypothetical protein
VKAVLKGGLALALGSLLVLGARGQESEQAAAANLDEHPEVEEVLQALDEAGVPPTREELDGFMRTVDVQGTIPRQNGSAFPFGGKAAFRLGRNQAGYWDHYGKLDLSSRWLRMRARYRKHNTGWEQSNAAVALGSPSAELRVGSLGVVQGFGLLMGAPGRGSSLAADAGLKAPAPRLVTWVGTPDSRTLAGWQGGDPDGPVSAVQVSGEGQTWRISGAVVGGPSERGGSLAWGVRSTSLSMNVETVLWIPESVARPVLSAVGHLGWFVGRSTGIELQFGFADQPDGPLLGSRPAVLPGWAGRGFALRGFAPLGDGVRCRALVWLGHLPDRAGVRGHESKSLFDFQLAKNLGHGLDLGLRYRGSGRHRREWSERFPWQPNQPVLGESRGVLTGQISWETSGHRIRMLVRTYGREMDSGGGRRSLAGFSGRMTRKRVWTFRGSYATAWGDPVDLVSAVSPLTGFVLPRHWGNWRSETMAALEWADHGGRIQAAISRRMPEKDLNPAPDLTAWIQAGWAW